MSRCARSLLRFLIRGCARIRGGNRGLGLRSGLAGGDRQQLGGQCLNLALHGGGIDAGVGVGQDRFLLVSDGAVGLSTPVWGGRAFLTPGQQVVIDELTPIVTVLTDVASLRLSIHGRAQRSGPDVRVASGERDVASGCLGDQHPVEGVSVFPGHAPGEDGVCLPPIRWSRSSE